MSLISNAIASLLAGMTLEQTITYILLGQLFFSSVVASVSLTIVLAWLYSRRAAFWLRLMLTGSLLYNLFLSVVTFLNLIGVTRATNPFAFLLFVLLIQAHFLMSNGITLFDLSVLGVIPEPTGTFTETVHDVLVELLYRLHLRRRPPSL